MYCPFCSNKETKVLESRINDDSLRRRRECLKCRNRFTTYEKASFSLTVLKKDGKVQPFDIKKISQSIEKASGKADQEIISKLTKKVEQKILRKKTNPIETLHIGRFVLQELKKYDKIAYLRFASVYKSIDDPKMLEKEINQIVKQ
ncbi:MAG: ATP cone domain-containing protein [Nanoarchaeota archaeon]|nr:transcriptional regulator NrdR [Nanoarchaeota archaeon]MBU1632364.1 transcriptional regulator NrdR [Nanoarchaeota archaeon]MBU1875533.1 transcriptional regulator NrdR [Nanoarchaeota archaeon]